MWMWNNVALLFSRPNFKPRRRQLCRRCALRSGRPSTTTRASSRATASSDTSRSASASPGGSSTRSASPAQSSPAQPAFLSVPPPPLSSPSSVNLTVLFYDRFGVVCWLDIISRDKLVTRPANKCILNIEYWTNFAEQLVNWTKNYLTSVLFPKSVIEQMANCPIFDWIGVNWTYWTNCSIISPHTHT